MRIVIPCKSMRSNPKNVRLMLMTLKSKCSTNSGDVIVVGIIIIINCQLLCEVFKYATCHQTAEINKLSRKT